MADQRNRSVSPPLPAALVRKLIERLPPQTSGGLNKQMWYGYGVPPVVYRPWKPDIDRPINILPTMEREPDSDPPQFPIWINANCPPWVCPPFWSVPLDLPFSGCIPWYEVATLLDCFTVPQDRCLIIKNMSYQALNAVSGDVFEIEILVNNQTQSKTEDIFVDPAAVNPAQKYALAGHFRPMPLNIVADRNSTLCVRTTLRGPISYAGVSPYFPGQPIVSPDCQMKVILQGWLANLREDLDGGPRPTDLGDFGMIPLEDDQSRGGFP